MWLIMVSTHVKNSDMFFHKTNEWAKKRENVGCVLYQAKSRFEKIVSFMHAFLK
jgi:hypothetical protein